MITMNDISKMSDKDLIAEAKEAWFSINVVECFGSQDLLHLNMLEKELHKRGYEAVEGKKINYVKEGSED